MKSPLSSFAYAKFSAIFLLMASNSWAATMQDLGTLGGGFSGATAVSADGSKIVGYSTKVGPIGEPEFAFIYQNGAITELNFGDVSGSVAFDISSDGNVIVGSRVLNGDDLQRAVRYQDGIAANIEALPDDEGSSAWGISGDGNVIVGSKNIDAFKYSNGAITNIGNGGFEESAIAFDSSNDGSIIVGRSNINEALDQRAFKYDGTIHYLGTLGGLNSGAYAISNDGSIIVGFADNADDFARAAKFTNNTITDLGTLGGDQSVAHGISGDGSIIVGAADIAGNLARRAFKHQNGIMTDLGTLGGTNSVALAISADGKVVVGSSDIAGDAETHAFLLNIGSTNLPDDDNLNLVDINNTALAIANNGRQLNSILTLNESILNFALDQDATLFGANNISVTIGSRYTKINPYSTDQVAATLKVAYRFNDNIRAGVFLDQGASSNMPDNFNLNNNQPLVGFFTAFSQNKDGSGAQLRLSAAYNSADLSIARTTLANTEAGKGTSSLTSKGALAELSYAFKLTENLKLKPLTGARFTKVSRDSYVEDSGADFAISYKNMEKKSSTAFAGLQLLAGVTTKLSVQTKLVFERDLYRSIDAYQGDVSYLGAFKIDAPHLKKNRFVASFGGAYSTGKTQEIGFGFIYGQHNLNNNNAITGYLNYTIGL